MPPRRGRPRKGEGRIDAAIDHFVAMGYAERDVRAALAELLKVYGGPAAWPLLEEGSYDVVQNFLFEKEEERRKQEQPLPLEHKQQEADQQVGEEEEPPQVRNGEQPLPLEHKQQEEDEQVGEESPQLQEPEADEAPPALRVVLPCNAATMTTNARRRPCYGWLSESEDEQPTGH